MIKLKSVMTTIMLDDLTRMPVRVSGEVKVVASMGLQSRDTHIPIVLQAACASVQGDVWFKIYGEIVRKLDEIALLAGRGYLWSAITEIGELQMMLRHSQWDEPEDVV